LIFPESGGRVAEEKLLAWTAACADNPLDLGGSKEIAIANYSQ
jgi:hypothetical protein